MGDARQDSGQPAAGSSLPIRGVRRFRLATRASLVRLAVMLSIVGLGGCYMMSMPGRSFRGPLPPMTADEKGLAEAIRADLTRLAVDIGERNVFRGDRLQDAARFIEESLAGAGYTVRSEEYEVCGQVCRNLEAERKGGTHPEEIVVVGAHYDTVTNCPGADDNGSAVAGLLALARAFAGRSPARTVRFVAFTNEEPPFFMTPKMGSRVYSSGCRGRGDDVVSMVSLEMLGYYDPAKGAQAYPFPLSLFYPNRGDFIAFVGSLSSRRLVRRTVRAFRRHAQFPSEGAVLPSVLPGVAWSDHWAFWQEGYPAIMVTDTAFFRNRHYHTSEDTIDKLDLDRMARVVAGLEHVVADLAGEE